MNNGLRPAPRRWWNGMETGEGTSHDYHVRGIPILIELAACAGVGTDGGEEEKERKLAYVRLYTVRSSSISQAEIET